jgi:glyoxylase-like metal-dependent hydrolase (beta-lactamase superfamily II)
MPEGSHAFPVGSIRCTVLSDGYASYPAAWYFSQVEPGQLSRALAEHRLTPERILSPFTCLLIETGRHIVLCDTGAGPAATTSGALLARLDVAGIRARDVDTVILSHAHPEQIGGAVDGQGRPVFANARHIILDKELEFWNRAHPNLSALDVPEVFRRTMIHIARESLDGLRHQLETVERRCEIVPGVTVVPAPGHTPGHLAVEIVNGDDGLLHLGDAAFHPIHLEQPEWLCVLDLDATAATESRRALLTRAIEAKLRVMAFHFPFPSLGTVAARAEGGWSWSPGWAPKP